MVWLLSAKKEKMRVEEFIIEAAKKLTKKD